MSENKIFELNEESLSTLFESEFVSPYGLCKFVNGVMTLMGINQELPPQMFYTYVKKGFIAANSEKKVSKKDAIEWTLKYLSKKVK